MRIAMWMGNNRKRSSSRFGSLGGMIGSTFIVGVSALGAAGPAGDTIGTSFTVGISALG